MSILNHEQQAFNLTLSQYKNSPKLIGTVNSFLEISQDIENKTQTLFEKFNLETATDDFLDAIGQLLAVERFPVLDEENKFFQFDVTPLDEGYRFFDGEGTPYVLIDDEFYRRALKAWTVTMNSVGSINELILSIAYLFGVPVSLVTIKSLRRFQFDVTPLDSGYALDWSYNEIDINVDFALVTKDISMYNYVTKSGSRLWAKVAGVKYTLTHL